MRLQLIAAILFLASCASTKRHVEFQPEHIGKPGEEALFVCFQSEGTDKLVCFDFRTFLEAAAARSGESMGDGI